MRGARKDDDSNDETRLVVTDKTEVEAPPTTQGSKEIKEPEEAGALISGDSAQQLMIASRLIRIAQRFPRAKPQTTADEDIEQLNQLANRTHENLFESKPVALYAFSGSMISIDRQKVTIVQRGIFNVRRTTSIQIGDIINVQATTGPMYGSLTITSKHFLNNVQHAQHLRRTDVVRARRLLQGLIIACQEKVDITKIETKKLLSMLTDLGQEHRLRA